MSKMTHCFTHNNLSLNFMMFKLANISLNSFFCSLYDAVYFRIKFNVACLIDGR